MAEHTSRRRRRSGWGLVFAATTALGAAVAFPGDTRRARGPGGLIADRQHDVIGCRGCDPDAFAAAARRRVGQRLMASYHELYAEIVGDRDVLYDATAEAHHRIAGLLTSDSPPEDGAG